jgi:guanylate kinase
MDILGLNNVNTETLLAIIKLYENKRVIIVGETCSGKDHLKNTLLANGFDKSISYTTRQSRENEKHGIDYFFVDEHQFLTYVKNGWFYEWDNFNGSSYGTTNTEWYGINSLDSQSPLSKVFIMTPQSIEAMSKEDRESSLVIYLKVNQELQMERLNARGYSQEEIDKRLLEDEVAFFAFVNWDIFIIDLTII